MITVMWKRQGKFSVSSHQATVQTQAEATSLVNSLRANPNVIEVTVHSVRNTNL